MNGPTWARRSSGQMSEQHDDLIAAASAIELDLAGTENAFAVLGEREAVLAGGPARRRRDRGLAQLDVGDVLLVGQPLVELVAHARAVGDRDEVDGAGWRSRPTGSSKLLGETRVHERGTSIDTPPSMWRSQPMRAIVCSNGVAATAIDAPAAPSTASTQTARAAHETTSERPRRIAGLKSAAASTPETRPPMCAA